MEIMVPVSQHCRFEVTFRRRPSPDNLFKNDSAERMVDSSVSYSFNVIGPPLKLRNGYERNHGAFAQSGAGLEDRVLGLRRGVDGVLTVPSWIPNPRLPPRWFRGFQSSPSLLGVEQVDCARIG